MAMTELHWTLQSDYPLLAALQLLPLAGMVLVLLLRHRNRVIFPVGLGVALLELLLALDLYRRFDESQGVFQFAERLELLSWFNYHVAADGVTVLFVLLTALLTLLVTIYGQVRGLGPAWAFTAVVLVIQSVTMSLFLTLDLLWFVLFSALQLILVGHLLWRWATSPEKGMMLARYLQFMGSGILLLLAGVVMLGWNYADASGGSWTFNLFELVEVPVAASIQSVIFFLFFFGLAVRLPLFPLHGWLPLAAEHGNVAVAPVFLLGMKVGIYGMLRFVLPVVPEAVQEWHQYVVAFAVGGIFYGALMALMQVNLRRLLAFAVVSHTGILVIGLFSLNPLSFQGSVMLSVNFGLAITGLSFMTGFIYRRTRTTLLRKLGGLFDRIPFIGITFLVAGLSIVGMPGTPGFDAAHLVLEGSMKHFGALVTIAAALGNVVAAGFLLWAFQRAFLAPRPEGRTIEIEPASTKEQLIAGILVVVLLGAGFYSEPWLELIENSFAGLTAIYGGQH